MNKNELTSIKEEAKKDYKEFVEKYKRAIKKDDEEAREALVPGKMLGNPFYYGFYSEQNHRNFIKSVAAEYANKMRFLADKVKESVAAEMSLAPSVECVNALNAMQLLENPQQELLEAMMTKYGDNYLAFKAIMEKGRKSNVILPYSHECEQQDELCEQLTECGNRFNRVDLSNVASDGAMDVFNMMLDGDI